MITASEEDYIRGHAYVPEHLTQYVVAISQVEPFLFGDYLCYKDKGVLIFVGYPLRGLFHRERMNEILDTAVRRFKPEQVSLIAPEISLSKEICHKSDADHYFRCDLSHLHIPQKLRNMIHRASRELYLERGREVSDEHAAVISEFLGSHSVDDATRYILERVPQYVFSSTSARVLSARDRSGRLVAFSVAEFGAKDYAFYMFNFISRKNYVPGASDFLLHDLIKTAEEEGKSFVNLGLGINEGITFFKKKFGGIPFLRYEYCLYSPVGKRTLTSMIQRLYGPINSYVFKTEGRGKK